MAMPLRSCHSVMPFSALYQENATAATSAQWNSRVGRSQTCNRTVSSPRAMLSGLLHERRIVVDHRGRRGGDPPAAGLGRGQEAVGADPPVRVDREGALGINKPPH